MNHSYFLDFLALLWLEDSEDDLENFEDFDESELPFLPLPASADLTEESSELSSLTNSHELGWGLFCNVSIFLNIKGCLLDLPYFLSLGCLASSSSAS